MRERDGKRERGRRDEIFRGVRVGIDIPRVKRFICRINVEEVFLMADNSGLIVISETYCRSPSYIILEASTQLHETNFSSFLLSSIFFLFLSSSSSAFYTPGYSLPDTSGAHSISVFLRAPTLGLRNLLLYLLLLRRRHKVPRVHLPIKPFDYRHIALNSLHPFPHHRPHFP